MGKAKLTPQNTRLMPIPKSSAVIIATIVFWPRKPEPIECEERELLNGKLMVPKD